MSAVCNDIDWVSNPRLCDRSAVKMVCSGESVGISTNTNASSVGGKRKQVSAHNSIPSRRRLNGVVSNLIGPESDAESVSTYLYMYLMLALAGITEIRLSLLSMIGSRLVPYT